MLVGFDYETTEWGAGYVGNATPVGYSVSTTPGVAMYVPSDPASELFNHRLVCHNAKFEYTMSHKLGHEMASFEDTKLAAYLLGYPSTGLKDLTKQLLGIEPITYQQATGGRTMDMMQPREIVAYAAADADHTLRLWDILKTQLHDWKLHDLYSTVERPLIPVLAEMESRGIYIDSTRCEQVGQVFKRKQQQANRAAGMDLGSRDKLAAWLEAQDAPIYERTSVKKQMKTDYNTIVKLGASGWRPELTRNIVDYYQAVKLAAFPADYVARGPVLHPSLNQCGHYEEKDNDARESPATGRLSCSRPNLQQIPKEGRGKGAAFHTYGAYIRSCLVARPGYVFVGGDIAQQEPRVMAVVAPDDNLRADLESGTSPYAQIGKDLYDREVTKADKQEWHTAKTFFLAFQYGADANKLLEIDPRMTMHRAREGFERVNKRYPGIGQMAMQTKLDLVDKGHVRDYFGRVRWLPGVYSNDMDVREEAFRQAINMRIQGPSATSIKMAMIRTARELDNLDAHLVMQIHDQLIVEARADLVDKVVPILTDMCQGHMPIDMPVDIEVGLNLGEMERHVAA